jgi:peptidoglycan/xylan/chitin deacetylase (PgdA/CDA1 family)
MRIPITMSHGTTRGPYFMPKPRWRDLPPLGVRQFERYFGIAAELGFRSISYDALESWRERDAPLPPRPILLDFDHPNLSIHREVWPIMRRHGFTGTLFINTVSMEKESLGRFMSWDEIRELVADGWSIGSHMHHHIGLDHLAKVDPTGMRIREEMERCDAILRAQLGITSRDFAYIMTTWSETAEQVVGERYRFGRMWTIGAHVKTDKGKMRFADLAGVTGEDEPDGGPPMGARYITKATHPLRLPAMDFEYLIYEYDAFRQYLTGAIEEEQANMKDMSSIGGRTAVSSGRAVSVRA